MYVCVFQCLGLAWSAYLAQILCDISSARLFLHNTGLAIYERNSADTAAFPSRVWGILCVCMDFVKCIICCEGIYILRLVLLLLLLRLHLMSRGTILRKALVVDEEEYQKYRVGRREGDPRDDIDGFRNTNRMRWLLFAHLHKKTRSLNCHKAHANNAP